MKLVKKILIQPTKSQKETIDFWLRKCKILYNVALEERIIYYKATGKTLSVYDQKKELVDIKNFDASWKDVPNKSLQDVLFRLDKSYKSFFKRKYKGFPKFKSEYDSLYFVANDVRIKDNLLFLPKIKTQIKYNESIPTNYSSCVLKKENNHYYLCFVTEVNEKNEFKNNDILGIDLGLESLYTDSNGIKQNRFSRKLIKKYQKRIAELNQSLATKEKGSIRRGKVKKQLSKTYSRFNETKKDFLHKVSCKLLNSNEDNIFIGDIQIQNIIDKYKDDFRRKNLIKSFYVNALGIFKTYIEYKAKLRNKNLVFINERYTSKTCSCCGHIKEMKLSDRWYECNFCENSIDRDHNSAINMKLLGSSIMFGNEYSCSLNENLTNRESLRIFA